MAESKKSVRGMKIMYNKHTFDFYIVMGILVVISGMYIQLVPNLLIYPVPVPPFWEICFFIATGFGDMTKISTWVFYTPFFILMIDTLINYPQ